LLLSSLLYLVVATLVPSMPPACTAFLVWLLHLCTFEG